MFLEVLEEFSGLGLYGYMEADRRRFDVAATLSRDWSRPLAGQTLWKHTTGIDKDLRMLLSDPESEIKSYIALHTVKHRRKVAEARRGLQAHAAGPRPLQAADDLGP